MIRVLITDDHLLVRQGIRALLEACDDIEVVGEAENGNQAIQMCSESNPDIVLMDLIMPEVDGIAATEKILDDWSNIKIIALTSFVDRKLIEESLKAGAIGYIQKNVSGDELVSIIRNAYQGKPTLSSEASDFLISNLKKPLVPEYNLTSQEKNILSSLVEGLSNKEIAKKQVLSISTVKFHVSNILTKLGASSRAEAVSIALKNKLVE